MAFLPAREAARELVGVLPLRRVRIAVDGDERGRRRGDDRGTADAGDRLAAAARCEQRGGDRDGEEQEAGFPHRPIVGNPSAELKEDRPRISAMAATQDPRHGDATDAWRRDAYAASPERGDELTSTISGVENEPLVHPGQRVCRPRPRPGLSRAPIPFTRGVYPSMYRGRLWTMRQFAGYGGGGGDERALPLPARARADRALDRFRHADADGLRLRPPALARRGGPRGRRGRLARGHGDAVRAASRSARSRRR